MGTTKICTARLASIGFYTIWRNLVIVSIFLLFCISSLNAQNETIDSLNRELNSATGDSIKIEILLELTSSYNRINKQDLAFEAANQALSLSKETSYSQGEGDAYHKLGITKIRTAEYDQAIDYFQKALVVRKVDKDLRRISYSTINLGVVYLYTNRYEKALEQYKEALRLGKKLQDTVAIGSSYINLGIVFSDMSQYDSSVACYKKGIALFEAYNSINGAGNAYNGLGAVYQDRGNLTEAKASFQKAIEFYEQAGNSRGISASILNIGNALRREGNFPRALEEYQRSYSMKKDNKDRKGQAIVLGNIGILYKEQEDYSRAIEYFEQSLELYRELKIPHGIARIYAKIGDVNREQLALQKANEAYLNGLAVFNDNENFKSKIQILNGLGFVRLAEKKPKEATQYFEKALDLESGTIELTATTYRGLAQSLFDQGNIKKAEELALKGFNISEGVGFIALIQQHSELLSEIYSKQTNYREAFKYQKIYQQYSDSLFNEQNVKKITQLELEYAFNEEKKAIQAEQEKNDFILQNELKKRKLTQNFYLAGGILFLLLFISVYISYRRKKRDNLIIQDQNRSMTIAAAKLKASNERLSELSSLKEGLNYMIAHDMKNSLDAILEYAKNNPSDHNMHQINRTGTLVLNLVTNMLDVQAFEENRITVVKEECSLNEIIAHAKSQIGLLVEMNDLEITFHAMSDIKLSADKSLLERVIINLLTNAVKHSEKGKTISIATEQTQKNTLIKVSDQGHGISSDKLDRLFDKFWELEENGNGKNATTGLGLAFCKFAIEAHHGTIEVSSEVNKGSTFTITLPNR